MQSRVIRGQHNIEIFCSSLISCFVNDILVANHIISSLIITILYFKIQILISNYVLVLQYFVGENHKILGLLPEFTLEFQHPGYM